MRWCLLLLMMCSTVRAEERITVDRAEPDVKRVTFNPLAPPPDMPKLKPNESAYCAFHFDCQLNWGYRVSQQSTSDKGRSQVVVIPETGQAELQLTVTLWLPLLASRTLVAHEEGHQKIAERVYGEAEKTVRKAMFESLGKGVKGDGTSEADAIKAALDALNSKVLANYLKRTVDRTQQLSDAYDELTDHGRKRSPTADQAIEEAFRRETMRTGEAPVSR